MQKDYNYHKLVKGEIPQKLRQIDDVPEQLFYRGENPNALLDKPSVAIVGSRKPTNYGREVTIMLARELAAKGVIVISGLALGVDSIAHQACIEAGGKTIAVLPCGPEMIYPSTHHSLAIKILQTGGSLVTEYPEDTPALKQNFIARNRLVSGMADIVIVTEAAEKSGTLHTANFALSQGKTVMAVPGPISSPLSKGTNNLIKTGAIPITDVSDVTFKLGLSSSKKHTINASNEHEYVILSLLLGGTRDGHELLNLSGLEAHIFNQTLTMLEINGQIMALGSNQWQIK